jgi:MFS family permease
LTVCIRALQTAYFSGQLLCAPFLGLLADRWGRRPALLLSLVVALLGGAAAGMAPVSSASAAGAVPLLIAVFVQGCGVGGAIPITEALVVEYFDEEDVAARGWWACLVSLGWPFGSVLSTAIAWILVPAMVHHGSGSHNNSSSSSISGPSRSPELFLLSSEFESGGSLYSDHAPSPSDTNHGDWQTAYSAQGGLHGWPGVYVVLSLINLLAVGLLWACLPESPIFLKLQRESAADNNKVSHKVGALQDVSSTNPARVQQHQQQLAKLLKPAQPRSRLTCAETYTWVLICSIWFAVSFSGNGFAVTLPLFLNSKNSASAASADPHVYAQLMLWSAVGIPGVFIAAWAVEAESLGRKRVVVLSSLLTSVCFFVFTLCRSPVAATLTSSAQNVVVMCCWSGIATLTSELAPTTHRARLLGVSNMVKALAGIFGPYVGGFFVSSRPVLPLFVFSGVMLLGAIAGVLLPKDTRGQKLANDWYGDDVDDDDDDGDWAENKRGLLRNEGGSGS